MTDKLRSAGRYLRRLHNDEGGQAMTEAALMLPLFIVLVAMTLEMCVLASVKSVVNFAAYTACRAGIVHNADPNYMIVAGSMALSPVSQSSFIPTRYFSESAGEYDEQTMADKVTGRSRTGSGSYESYGGWHEKNTNKPDLGVRIGNFGAGTVVAMVHFNGNVSVIEYAWRNLPYLFNDVMAAISSLTGALSDLQSNIEAGNFFDAIDNIQTISDAADDITTVAGDVAWVLRSRLPINSIAVLAPTPEDSETVIAETGSGFALPSDGAKWLTRDDEARPTDTEAASVVSGLGTTASGLRTEGGVTKTGIDFGHFLSGQNKSLRLRIRLTHRHFLMFPFLRTVYMGVSDRRDTTARDDAVIQMVRAMGVVQIDGYCTMRMQSNLTLDEK